MQVKINGNEESLCAQTTLADFLTAKGYLTSGIIVVYNDNVLPKEDWPMKFLQDGDSIEILRFLGGG